MAFELKICSSCTLSFSSIGACLPTEKEHKPIGLWAQRHKRYLQEHKRAVYTTLLASGKLNSYLADIDEKATDMMFRLVEQMSDKEGVTEQLKAENPML